MVASRRALSVGQACVVPLAVGEGVDVIRGPVSVFDDETLTIRPGWPQDREYVRVRRKSGEVVFEWHRRGWQSATVRAIKATVRDAADRMDEVIG